MVCIENKDADNVVREFVEEISADEVKEISKSTEVRKEEITDEAKVRRIELKIRMGDALSEDEKKAIDLNDPTPGFNAGKIFADRVDKLEVEELKV